MREEHGMSQSQNLCIYSEKRVQFVTVRPCSTQSMCNIIIAQLLPQRLFLICPFDVLAVQVKTVEN
jgi:hypothetical protein